MVIKWIKNLGHLVYRCWFYILVALPIFIFFPLLFATTLSERTFKHFYWLARNIWAKPILYAMGCPPKISWESNVEQKKSFMLVANHTSMLDIMLMLYVSKNPFVFVGKKELVHIPVFGFFYKRVCILVDRSSAQSRTAVYRQVQRKLKQGLGICIFPEGGVPEESVLLDRFKDGAFRMAINHNLPLLPMVFLDNKRRFSWTFFSGSPGVLRVQVFAPIRTEALELRDKETLKHRVRTLMLSKLESE